MPKLILVLNILLLIVFLFYLLRYLRSLFQEGFYRPEEWSNAVSKKLIDNRLSKTRRKYPDKLRFYTFWLQTERLRRDKVKGAFAELGVYKGETAKVLHHLDPGRDLHLFDTFSGFKAEDLEGEVGEAGSYSTSDFADTSLDKVKAYLGYNARIHYHPGHFPASSAGLESLTFALVSLDADLYQPTLAALNFFYPRLSPGGVIFVHDYNFRWAGIKKAVDEFCRENTIQFVLIPDRDGTVVITRS